MVGTGLHVRAFDAVGAKVVDQAEQDLARGELLEKVRGRFEFDIGRVLVAGKWLTARERDVKPGRATRAAVHEDGGLVQGRSPTISARSTMPR